MKKLNSTTNSTNEPEGFIPAPSFSLAKLPSKPIYVNQLRVKHTKKISSNTLRILFSVTVPVKILIWIL